MDSLLVAVTGGAGRVGSAIVEELLAHGHRPRVLDLRPPKNRDVEWRFVDTLDRKSLHDALVGVDAVCHLGEPGTMFGEPLPDRFYQKNITSGTHVMQLAADLHIPRVVYASSCQVLGTWGHPGVPPLYLPVDDEHPPQPQYAYPMAKLAVEQFAQIMVKTSDTSVAAFRLPSTWRHDYQPEATDVQFFRKRSGPYSEMGVYLHGTDAARAFRLAIERPQPGFETYILAAADVSMLEPLQQHLCEQHPDYPPLPDGWGEHVSPVVTRKAKEHFGWEPQWSVLEHIRPFLDQPAPDGPMPWRRPWW